MPATGSCSGQVEGGSVRYVRNEIKYISLEELGIDPAKVTEGEAIFLKFNSSDEVIGSELSRDITARGNIGITSIITATLLLPIIVRLLLGSGGKRFALNGDNDNFYQTYIIKDKIYFCRWFCPEGGSIKYIGIL